MTTHKPSYHKNLLILGAFLGFLGIILGAYGAHGLKPMVSSESMESFETGVRFQIYHAFFALIVGALHFISKKDAKLLFGLTLFGVLFFSGSIYGLATQEITGFDYSKIALITPLGGLLLIIAWGLLAVKALRLPVKN